MRKIRIRKNRSHPGWTVEWPQSKGNMYSTHETFTRAIEVVTVAIADGESVCKYGCCSIKLYWGK